MARSCYHLPFAEGKLRLRETQNQPVAESGLLSPVWLRRGPHPSHWLPTVSLLCMGHVARGGARVARGACTPPEASAPWPRGPTCSHQVKAPVRPAHPCRHRAGPWGGGQAEAAWAGSYLSPGTVWAARPCWAHTLGHVSSLCS